MNYTEKMRRSRLSRRNCAELPEEQCTSLVTAFALGILLHWSDTEGVSAIPHPVKMSVEEYLETTFRPDCDYVNGEIEERNLGEKGHAILQRFLTILFGIKRNEWRVEVYPELRVQVSPTRFRVPDVTVTPAGLEWERILRTPPLLCIEILSPRDSLSGIRQRADDYLNFGTEHVWVIEPEMRKAYIFTKTAMQEPEGGVLSIPGTEIRVVLSELFAELDRP
jgi:Uma2 family endonuclease